MLPSVLNRLLISQFSNRHSDVVLNQWTNLCYRLESEQTSTYFNDDPEQQGVSGKHAVHSRTIGSDRLLDRLVQSDHNAMQSQCGSR